MFTKKEFAFVSNLRFISSTNSMLSLVAHEENITSGPAIKMISTLIKTEQSLSVGLVSLC